MTIAIATGLLIASAISLALGYCAGGWRRRR